MAIVTEVCEADTGGGRLLAPLADDEADDPAGGDSDEPVTLLELPPGDDMVLEPDETVPDVSGTETDELIEFDALDPWRDDEGPDNEVGTTTLDDDEPVGVGSCTLLAPVTYEDTRALDPHNRGESG